MLTFIQYQNNSHNVSTRPTIAIVNGGGIRTGIKAGNITTRHLMSTFPFGNNLALITLNGKDIKHTLELSASLLDKCGRGKSGGFLQVSGR